MLELGAGAVVLISLWVFFCFLFNQKTAYEQRISDWSSDVCSSDLLIVLLERQEKDGFAEYVMALAQDDQTIEWPLAMGRADWCAKIGRASCRERVCQHV